MQFQLVVVDLYHLLLISKSLKHTAATEQFRVSSVGQAASHTDSARLGDEMSTERQLQRLALTSPESTQYQPRERGGEGGRVQAGPNYRQGQTTVG